MARILILFAHPALEKSLVHRRLLQQIPAVVGITLHDLYEGYPDYDIDVAHEQALLASHDLLVLQHPLFWYSVPPLVKQWLDLVLEPGWAYGRGGTALHNKTFLHLITTGGGADGYRRDGYHGFTIRELLTPVEQTFRLCGMRYLPPYVIYGAHRLRPDDIARESRAYGELLGKLQRDEIAYDTVKDLRQLNDVSAPREPARDR